jgi:chromosome segregation ATPase
MESKKGVSMSGFRNVLALAVVLDYEQRRRNYDEFRERVSGNIERWEEQLQRNKEAQSRANTNLTRNIERLAKSRSYLERLDSSTTREWLERTEQNAREHSKPEVRQAATAKVKEHYAKLADARQQYTKTQTWITEGREKLRDLQHRENELNSKISSARSKL